MTYIPIGTHIFSLLRIRILVIDIIYYSCTQARRRNGKVRLLMVNLFIFEIIVRHEIKLVTAVADIRGFE